ncbi:MAG: DUF2961 domain-containing protein, partial [Phycisphaerae bacterium]
SMRGAAVVIVLLRPLLYGNPQCWWIMRGTVGVPVQIAGVNLPPEARLKLNKRENITVPRLDEFTLMETQAAGALFLLAMKASSPNWNFMESCIRAYFSRAKTPELLSSGLEDYFCGTYYFASGMYHTPIRASIRESFPQRHWKNHSPYATNLTWMNIWRSRLMRTRARPHALR